MSYVIPSVLVYQQLENSGGAANTTPDLEVCLIGPAYNVVSYVAGSTDSLIQTAAVPAESATGSMTSGSAVVTFTTAMPFAVGDVLLVPGASTTGGTLSTTILSISGLTATTDTAAGTTVSNVTITKTAVISNSTVVNTFSLPSTKPGQVVDPDSVQVYLNNAKIETFVSGFMGYPGSNELDISAPTGTGSTTVGSPLVTDVTNATQFVVGDQIIIAGAGAAGANLTATIDDITGTTFVISAQAGSATTGAAITKAALSNVNQTTSTLLVEPGDQIEIDYTNVNGVASTFTTTVNEVTNATSTIFTLNTTDVLPSDLSTQTSLTAAVQVGATTITVANPSGILSGDTILIRGAAANNADLVTTVSAVSSDTITLSSAVTTAVGVGTSVIKKDLFTVKTRKVYNNQLLPFTNPSTGTHNYDASNAPTTGEIAIEPNPYVVYGRVVSGEVHFAYRALRTDLSGSLQTLSTTGDITGILGDTSDQNPLGLASVICMANTTTQINFIAVSSNDLLGYEGALEIAEGYRMYALVPLTQEEDILAAFQAHVDQLSTAEMAAWRIAIVNTAIPSTEDIGPYSNGFVNANGGNNTITVINGNYVLTASNATFMSDGVTPGDSIVVTAATGAPTQVGSLQVQQVLSNQQVVVAATGTATAVSYYVTRTLTKAQKATAVAAVSTTFTDKRVIHVQPDTVGVTVNGVVSYLPGYYLCAALGGMVAGFPVQQGFTNVGVAGIADLKYSNFYFTRAQMNTMAAAGTFLFVQETQGSIPYVRHELTTDMSVLEYRELLVVKNWDWLSYYFYDILKSFIGKWNITPDSLNTLRQTIISAAEQVKGQKQPKIGAPLLDYKIASIVQDSTSKDTVDVNMDISVVYPMNYINLYLII